MSGLVMGVTVIIIIFLENKHFFLFLSVTEYFMDISHEFNNGIFFGFLKMSAVLEKLIF
jgi:hypothetical protein